MLRILQICALATFALMMIPVSAGWAKNDTTYAVLHASEPALAADQGRIYFYREGGLMGAALQPSIMINGENSGGRAKPGDYFYVDRPAGTYEISTTTEKKEAVTLTLAAGQSKYVRLDVSMGFLVGHVAPSIIDPQQAVDEIKDCDFHEPKPMSAQTAQPAAAPSAQAAPVPAASAQTEPAAAAPAQTAPATPK